MTDPTDLPNPSLPLNRLGEITEDYGRMLNRSTGLCSLWTGACLGGLAALAFAWTWSHFFQLGRPDGSYVRFMVRSAETLPAWILLVAFTLPILWAPVMRGLGGLLYPERFGSVQAHPPQWAKGLEALEGPMSRWIPMVVLAAMALYALVLRPLLLMALNDPLKTKALPWAALAAPVLGLIWAFITPHLRKAEANEGTILLYVSGFLVTAWDLQILFVIIPMYALMAIGTIVYGFWAHARYRKAMADLKDLEPEAQDA